MVETLSHSDMVSGYSGLNTAVPPSTSSTTLLASSVVPLLPSAQWVQRTADTPRSAQYLATAANSASVSVVKLFTPTITGTPNFCTLRIWRPRFAKPASTAATFSLPKSSLATPPCIFSARTVATITAASGAKPALRHLMSKNFSAPRSAPKPASVTT